LCQNGEGSNGTGIEEIPNSNGRFKCFKCGESGDVLHFIGKEYGLTRFPDTLEEAYRIYDLTVEDKKDEGRLAVSKEKTIKEKEAKKESIEETKEQDYTEFFKEANKKLNENYAQNNNANYLKERGISIETQNRFNIGYVANWVSPTAKRAGKTPPSSPRVIIPTSNSSYMARHTTPNVKDYKVVKEGKSRLFNSETLSQASDEPIFIVEGEIDVMSIIEAGGQAIGLGGVANIKSLIKELEEKGEKSKNRPYIIYMDNDEAGKKAAAQLQEELKNKGYVYYDICKIMELNDQDGNPKSDELLDTKQLLIKSCKDANEALQNSKDGPDIFKSVIKNAKEKASEQMNKEQEDYYQEKKNRSAETFVSFLIKKPKIETGFKELDTFLDGGLYQALYILGAAMGAGKTTLILQMADYIAKSGQEVLFFSGEMSRNQILARSLSRLSYETCNGNTDDAFTARTIDSAIAEDVEDAPRRKRLKTLYWENYQDIDDKLWLYDDVYKIEEITKKIAKHKRLGKTKPVVFIDYLQKIRGTNTKDRRLEIDEILRNLKFAVTQYQIPIFVISSLNRDAFKSEQVENVSGSNGKLQKSKVEASETYLVQMKHFKESGNIEYEGDIIIGLSRESGEKGKNADERSMRLQVLKNKFGQRHNDTDSISFKYNPKFNYFEDCGEGTMGKGTKNNSSGDKDEGKYYISKAEFEAKK
jgi:replicative DNA helicase